MKYTMHIKNITLMIWWNIVKGKTIIHLQAMKFEANNGKDRLAFGQNCTLTQFMKGYTVLKGLEKFEHFEQSEYKVIKEEIIRNVIGNRNYEIPVRN